MSPANTGYQGYLREGSCMSLFIVYMHCQKDGTYICMLCHQRVFIYFSMENRLNVSVNAYRDLQGMVPIYKVSLALWIQIWYNKLILLHHFHNLFFISSWPEAITSQLSTPLKVEFLLQQNRSLFLFSLLSVRTLCHIWHYIINRPYCHMWHYLCLRSALMSLTLWDQPEIVFLPA